ncbi:MAG: hypothetical protein ACTSVI_02965 [Promethearchaeota archaeon]
MAWELESKAINKFKSGDYRDALYLFIEATSIDCSDDKLYYNLSLALAKLGDVKNSLFFLRKALEINSHDKNFLKLLSFLINAYRKQNPDDKNFNNLDWVRQYLKLKELFVNYFDFLMQDGLYDRYSRNYLVYSHVFLSRREGKLPSPFGSSSFEKNDFVDAIFYLSKVTIWGYRYLALRPLDSLSEIKLVDFLERNYRDLPENEKMKALIWAFSKGKKLYDNADYEEAGKIFEFLVKLEPINIAVLFQCGKTFRDSGVEPLVKKSIEYFKRILRIYYHNPLAWMDLAISYAILGDFQRELFCLKKAYESGHPHVDLGRVAYLEKITAPVDPFIE